ncbi:ABC transporter permease [Shinella granuli]|uniref:Peptide/nickel transport system permease protein n=2 Tax=Shinella granuli TaxID=323621 RepID=A0A4R2CA97_SHIGR|nr:peptide/nickel transport system permease protein [Shinella granuli]
MLKKSGKRILRSPVTMIGIAVLTAHMAIAALAPWLTPYGSSELAGMPFEPPSREFWLGTDILGRDYLTRLLMGGRITISVALCGVFIAIVAGAFFGLAAAWHGGMIDEVIMRLVDTKVAIPSILLVGVLIPGFGQSVPVLILVIALVYVSGVIRTVRALALTIAPQGFVTAAVLRGESNLSIMCREFLPNVLDLLCVEFAIRMSSAILLVSSLSFLGLGISPPTPDWGLMVSEGVGYIHTDPWLVIYPSIALSTLVVALNLTTEGVANALGLDAARGMTKG